MSTAPAPHTDEQAANGDGHLLDVDHLKVLFPIKSGLIVDRTTGHVHAVDDVSL
ncbi:MAG: hypothetical protein JO153_02710, partial [Solirubrobacterales bacterium]|nr:hypothetical protein [Solirubrobacterales bacterium]